MSGKGKAAVCSGKLVSGHSDDAAWGESESCAPGRWVDNEGRRPNLNGTACTGGHTETPEHHCLPGADRLLKYFLLWQLCRNMHTEASMKEHTCRSTHTEAYIQRHTCRNTHAGAHTQEHPCRSTHEGAHMQEHICRSMHTEAYMQKHP